MNTTSPASEPIIDQQRLERLGRYVGLDPANVALLRDYAQEAYRVSEADACKVAVRRLVELGVDAAIDHVLLARVLRRRLRLDEASQDIAAAAARWPDDKGISLERARCLFAMHDYEAALSQLPPALSEPLQPELEAASCELRVRLLHHLARLDEGVSAVETFRATVGFDRFVEAAYIAVLIDLSRLDEAKSVAQALMKDEPNEASLPYEVCEALALDDLQAGRPTEARRWTDRALLARRDDGRIWLIEGMTWLRDGKLDRAKQAFMNATELMAQHAGSHLALGWSHLLAGEHDAARPAFAAAQRASPSFAEGFGSMAVLDAMLGDAKAAQLNVRKARLLDRECASAQLALALLDNKQSADISKLAERVIDQARTSAPRRTGH